MKKKTLHGTTSTYINNKCRCPLCKEAWREYSEKRRQERREGMGKPTKHNRNTYTNWGCRCSKCRADWIKMSNAYNKEKRVTK